MRRVIVTADDLGLTEGINRGIFEAIEAGAVTSVSLMVRAPGWDDAIARLRAVDAAISVGLHFNLTVGSPLTDAPSLRDPGTGGFLTLPALIWRAVRKGVDPEDVRSEFSAQLAAFRGAGLHPTHVDSHQHVHMLPGIAPAVEAAARSLGAGPVRRPIEPTGPLWSKPRALLTQIAIRAAASRSGPIRETATAIHFRGMAVRDARDVRSAMERVLDRLPAGLTELVVHPGYATAELAALDPYTIGRERELASLTSPAVLARLSSDRVVLQGFTASC